MLRASTKRPVSLKGAYLERLVMNIYGGEGETEVYLDELTVGPVPAELRRLPRLEPPKGPHGPDDRRPPEGPNEPLEAVPPGLNTRIKLDRNRLTKDGFPWFFTAVRAPDADPSRLRRVGCDVLVVPRDTDEATIRAAIASGMLLIPELTGPDDRSCPRPTGWSPRATSFLGRDAVAFWSLGENLGRSTRPGGPQGDPPPGPRRRAGDSARPGPAARRLTTGTVVGMLPEYARMPENLDVIGIPTAVLGHHARAVRAPKVPRTAPAPDGPEQRRRPALGDIDASPPPIYQESIWGTDTPPAWGQPRVQPEQVRLSTYAALAAGCRGICFRADSDLTRDAGRANLIEMALLNEEIDLLEPILADPDKSVRMLDTYLPDPPPPPPMTLFQMNTGMRQAAADAQGVPAPPDPSRPPRSRPRTAEGPC